MRNRGGCHLALDFVEGKIQVPISSVQVAITIPMHGSSQLSISQRKKHFCCYFLLMCCWVGHIYLSVEGGQRVLDPLESIVAGKKEETFESAGNQDSDPISRAEHALNG